MNTIEILNGCPGAGKTSTLIGSPHKTGIMEEALASGSIKPEKIGFISFTRKALRVGIQRATEHFNLKRNDLPYFRTMHAMAYMLLARPPLMNGSMLQMFFEQSGVRIDGRPMQISSVDLTPAMLMDGHLYDLNTDTKDDTIIRLINFARVRYPEIADRKERLWNAFTSVKMNEQFQWKDVVHVADAYEDFRFRYSNFDHTDLLEAAVRDNIACPPLDLLLIDEAQDLSPLQWKFADQLIQRATRTVIVGDADQGIFEWAGAVPDYFAQLTRTHPTTPLLTSHRCPGIIQSLAQTVAGWMPNRDKKVWQPTGMQGTFEIVTDLNEIPFDTLDSWLILSRNGWDYKKAVAYVNDKHNINWQTGKPWPCKLKERYDGRTIHRAKGAEADGVVLYANLTQQEADALYLERDSIELRTLYVAITRARKALYVLWKPGLNAYDFDELHNETVARQKVCYNQHAANQISEV